jgi:mannose-1-phosphate guanylyltransferase
MGVYMATANFFENIKTTENMSKNIYCIIMAGGAGTRFWPLSRQSMPKQFLDIFGTGRSFIRHTYERFARLVPPEHFLVMTNSAYKDLVLEHIPELRPDQVMCEPIGRNTAPCIAYAAERLAKEDPEAMMIVTPSDHLILDEVEFINVARECIDYAAQNDALMTIGLRPTRPETGYGYIQVNSREAITKVKTFTEKPNLEMAQTFLASGEFLWNSGIFVWSVEQIRAALQRFLPELSALFAQAAEHIGTEREKEAIERVFSECRAISIDYGVMEKAENVYVHMGDFGWSDMGTWGSLYQYYPKDDEGNASSSECVMFDATGCLVSTPKDKLSVINGLKDYIVVDTPDVLMICPRSNEPIIKTFINEIRFRKGDKHI